MGRIHEALQQAGVRDASTIGMSRADDGVTFRAAWPSVVDDSSVRRNRCPDRVWFSAGPRGDAADLATNQRGVGGTAHHVRERQPRGCRAVPPAGGHAARRAERDQFAQSAAGDERGARRRQDLYRCEPGVDAERVVPAPGAARRHGLQTTVAQQHHRCPADAWSRRRIEIAVGAEASRASHDRAVDAASGRSARAGSDEQPDVAQDAACA